MLRVCGAQSSSPQVHGGVGAVCEYMEAIINECCQMHAFKFVGWLAGCLTGWSFDCLITWLVAWLVCGLVGWLVG